MRLLGRRAGLDHGAAGAARAVDAQAHHEDDTPSAVDAEDWRAATRPRAQPATARKARRRAFT